MENKKCDIVVIGAGGGGLVAAVRAAQLSGKKVIVLEKAATTGGGMQFARTMRVFGSKWQKDRGLPDKTAEFMRGVMDLSFWRVDQQLAQNAIRGTGWFFDWFCDLEPGIGDEFDVGFYLFDGPGGQLAPSIEGESRGGLRAGKLFMDVLTEKCAQYGVEVLTKTPFTDVEVQNGRVSAVIAQYEDKPLRIECDAVVIGSGGWIRNKEICDRVLPAFNRSEIDPGPHMSPSYTGDAFKILYKLGIPVDYDGCCFRIMGPHFHTGSSVLDQMAASDYNILVNLKGKRFTSEPMVPRMDFFDTGHVLIAQPGAVTYSVFDENTLAAAVKDAKNNAKPAVPPLMPPSYPDDSEQLKADIKKGLEGKDAFKADTPEELARLMGADPAGLAKTIADYNEYCKTGMDWDGYKDAGTLVPMTGPYYAVRGQLDTDGAFGGIRINANMEVLKTDDSAVGGLYATGDITSGRYTVMGDVKRQILNDMSWAFSSGFIAGTQVTEYLSTPKAGG